MDKHLLATFSMAKIEGIFNVYGSFTVEVSTDLDILNGDSDVICYKYPDFFDISMTRLVDGVEECYFPEGNSWSGHKYDCCDIANFLISALIRGDKSYTKIYLDSELETIVNSYTECAITIGDNVIPKRILAADLYNLYQLVLVTNNYIYYLFGDSMIMLCAQEHTVVSDNYFAEAGFTDSIENINSGKETLLWGEIVDCD